MGNVICVWGDEMIQFPDPRGASPEGIVAVGGKLDVKTLTAAYRQGIFPWPQAGLPLLWFSPDPRGVLDFSEFHVPRSLKRWARTQEQQELPLSWSVDRDFARVIRHCRSQERPGQLGTWITTDIENAYIDLFHAGFAHSVEIWQGETLVGGIYGVMVETYFSAESMFYLKPNASKVGLWRLVEWLQTCGKTWMDIQMVTPVTESFGGKLIPRDEFLKRTISS